MHEAQEEYVSHDNGGSRSGKDRRHNLEPYRGKDNRSGKERRSGVDRRGNPVFRKTPERGSSRYWNGKWVERRDAFRCKLNRP